jgi:hypothetical protein
MKFPKIGKHCLPKIEGQPNSGWPNYLNLLVEMNGIEPSTSDLRRVSGIRELLFLLASWDHPRESVPQKAPQLGDL